MFSVKKTISIGALAFGCVAGINVDFARAATKLTGKLWLVPLSNLASSNPAPSSPPDATFSLKHVSFNMNAPGGNDTPALPPNLNNAVGAFLNSADKVTGLTFSGMNNFSVGGTVNASTPVINTTSADCGGGTYGTYMVISGTLSLTTNEAITIAHDDGVTLTIDGAAVSGLTSGATNPVAEVVQFTGKTGTHSIVLTYANSCGNGYLSFSPAL